MRIKRKLKRFVHRRSFWVNFSLFCLFAVSLPLSSFPLDKEWNDYIGWFLIATMFSSAAILILRIVMRLKKIYFYIFMAAQIVIAVWVYLFINVVRNDVILDILIYSIVSYFILGFFVLYIISKVLSPYIKKLNLLTKLKIHLHHILIFFILILIGFSTYTYLSFSKKITRLERIIGPKKILCDEKESIKEAKKKLVRIIGINSEGTGFFVSATGLIVTNYHVIAYNPNPKIVFPDYSFVQGEVIMADEMSDLAFIKIYGKENLPIFNYADSDKIEPMEEIISLGFPLGTKLRGEATAIKGRFVALRPDNEYGLEFVQTDLSLNPGSSGGPMINVCGELVAINTVGTAGLGMGISVNDFQLKWSSMAIEKEPLKDVKEITLKPNDSPEECVKAFYNYQTIGKLKEAYELLTRNYTDQGFEDWKEGYKNTFNILLYTTEELEDDKVFVKFSSADLVYEEIDYRYFEGEFEVKKIDGQYKLNNHNIKEVEDPDWDWFLSSPYDEEDDD